MNLSLFDAFGKFGSKPTHRLRALSGMAADGAMVLNCSKAYFGHPAQGVLRYEDRLSREATVSKSGELLIQHLTLARDGELPVRMVVTSEVDEKRRTRSFHVRADLIGKVVKFDGDHFIVDFTRRPELLPPAPADRRKKGAKASR
jgi:hypothetical protein